MTEKKSFEIYLVSKIPYLTKFAGILVFLSSVSLAVLFFKYVSKHPVPSDFVPVSTRIIFYVSSISLVVSFLVYVELRRRTKGVIVFGENVIEIILRKRVIQIPLDIIRKVYIHDPQGRNGAKNRLSLLFMLHKDVNWRVRLIDYHQADKLIEKLYKYDGVKLNFIEFISIPE